MGLFSKLFSKKNQEEEDQEAMVFYADQGIKMRKASIAAQENFKYFWREVYWEYRRIVPAHDFAMVKIPFEEVLEGHSETTFEHMWIDNIQFDGLNITGELVNDPIELTSISKGDLISKKVTEIGDWMFSIDTKTYGGFTIQSMRSTMNAKERISHDTAWRLNFGDYNDILVAYDQKQNPQNLIEHPMAILMADKLAEHLTANPSAIIETDADGHTLLHLEAIAGNKAAVDVLVKFGCDTSIKSNAYKTALDYARDMGWEHIEKSLI